MRLGGGSAGVRALCLGLWRVSPLCGGSAFPSSLSGGSEFPAVVFSFGGGGSALSGCPVVGSGLAVFCWGRVWWFGGARCVVVCGGYESSVVASRGAVVVLLLWVFLWFSRCLPVCFSCRFVALSFPSRPSAFSFCSNRVPSAGFCRFRSVCHFCFRMNAPFLLPFCNGACVGGRISRECPESATSVGPGARGGWWLLLPALERRRCSDGACPRAVLPLAEFERSGVARDRESSPWCRCVCK